MPFCINSGYHGAASYAHPSPLVSSPRWFCS
jgi:hypothetical protein